MSKTLEQMQYEHDERRFNAVHGLLPEPEPYPSAEGIEVVELPAVPAECWVPACNGQEKPFVCHGIRWLYVWCRALGKHGYYNMDTDIVYDDPDFHPANVG